MNILFIAGESHPELLGGIETFGRNLKKYFGKDLKFIANIPKRKRFYKVEDIIEIKELNIIEKVLNKILKNKLKKRTLEKIIERLKPDYLILNRPNEVNLVKNIKVPKILVQHINYDIYLTAKNYFNNNLKYSEKILQEIDCFVFLSEFDKEKFIKELNFPKEKAITIRHSCKVAGIKEIKNRNKKLLMIARLDNKQKRFDLAILAMKKLKGFTLDIYGSGKDENYILELIKNNNLANVKLHRGITNVEEILDKYGIFIMTSDYEGYGITNIEAMRRGLPIILRDTFEAAKDVVVANQNGILLDKEWNEEKFIKSIYKIYNNYEYYSKNAILLGKRYDEKIIEKEWKALLKKIDNKSRNL